MNKNNRLLLVLAVLLVLGNFCSDVCAQLKRNVLHIHFQTAVIHPSTSDTVLNTYYWIESYSPFTFTGFDYGFNYDNTKLAPENAFFTGTNQGHGTLNHATYTFDVQVDNSPQSIDTSSKILFQIRYLVIPNAIKDSAMITPDKFYAGGFDSVYIDNAAWDPVFLWHSFGLLFHDTTKPLPPKKVNVTLSSDSTRIDSNSIKIIPIRVTELDSAHIKSATFEFDFDTSLFDSAALFKGALLSNAIFQTKRDSNHVWSKFSLADTTFMGQGELLNLVLRGRKRSDTVCSMLENPKLTTINSWALVDKIFYRLGNICIFGKKEVIAKGVVAEKSSGEEIEMYPNPAHTFIDFVLPGGQELKKRCQVFDMLGRKALDVDFAGSYRWNVSSLPEGMYILEASDVSGKIFEKREILIIH